MKLVADRSLVGLVLSIALVISCASQAPVQSKKAPAGQTLDPYQTPVAGSNNGLKLCQGVYSTNTLPSVQPQGTLPVNMLDGNSLFLVNDMDQQVSLCSAFVPQQKKVAIFEFAGVLCLTCRDEAPQIQKFIASSSLGSQIAHIVVFTDFKSERTPAQVTDFLTKYTNSKATALFDQDQKLWKAFAQSSSPEFGTTIAINNQGQSVAVPNGRQLQTLLPNVEALVRAAK